MQFGLLHGTVPLRKRFTGRRRSVFLRTLLVLLVSVLHFRERITGIYLKVFADADYVSKATDRMSVSGGAIMCGGACLCWFSRTQKCVTLSTSEAEYVAHGDAVKELLFLRQVWHFMSPGREMPCF